MTYREQLAAIHRGMRRARKTDVLTDIVLVGGPHQAIRWFQCKIGSKTFSVDRPDVIPEWRPRDNGTGMRMRRYLYKVREIEGAPFVVGDFVEMDKW